MGKCMRCKQDISRDPGICAKCYRAMEIEIYYLRKHGKSLKADEMEDFLKPSAESGGNIF